MKFLLPAYPWGADSSPCDPMWVPEFAVIDLSAPSTQNMLKELRAMAFMLAGSSDVYEHLRAIPKIAYPDTFTTFYSARDEAAIEKIRNALKNKQADKYLRHDMLSNAITCWLGKDGYCVLPEKLDLLGLEAEWHEDRLWDSNQGMRQLFAGRRGFNIEHIHPREPVTVWTQLLPWSVLNETTV